MAGEFDWLKYGKDYPEVNKNLNGLPGFFQEIGRRWKENKGGPIERLLGIGEDPTLQAGQKYIVNPVSAALTGGANMALGGLPAAVAGKIAPQYAAQQAATRAAHPIATGIGQGAGLAGAVLAPTAAAGAGMQLGPAGAQLGTTLARNALISSAYAAPAAGAEAMQTGNIPKALLRGGLATLAGTALGTAGEKLFPALQRAASRAGKRTWGIRPGDIRQSLRGGSKAAGIGGEGARTQTINKAQALSEQLDDLIAKFGRGPKGAKEFTQSVSSGYKNLGQVYDKAGIKTADMLDDILKDPRIVGLKTDYPQLAGQIDDEILAMAGKVDRGTWRNAYAGWLKEAVTKGRQADDVLAPAAVRGKVAEVFRDNLGSAAETVRESVGGGQSLPELGRLVGAQHAVKGGVERAATSVGMGAREGSQTAPRLLTAIGPQQLGGAALGAGTGAAVSRPKKGATPAEWAAYLGRIVGSGVIGGALGRAGARGANAIAAPLLSGAAKALPLATGIGRAAGAMGAAQPLLESEATTPMARALTGQPEAAAETAPAEAAEVQAGPQGTEEAKQETNTAFQDRVIGELQKAWGGLQAAGTRMTFEEFTALVKQYTNDFDPKLTAPILFTDPEERERYLKTYEQALALKSMDLPGAFGSMRYFDPERDKNILAKRSLQNWMAGLLGGPEKMADPRLAELVEKDVEAIRRLRLPVAEKEAALRKLLQVNYGIDFDMLNQYGVEV